MRDATQPLDHGGGLDAAIARYGGSRADWLDLSTGINPVPYPVNGISAGAWTALPDQAAMDRLLAAARAFWNVPDGAMIIAAPGASSLIRRLHPVLCTAGASPMAAYIPEPTYNEWRAAFPVSPDADAPGPEADIHIYVHPNNPDGRLTQATAIGGRAITIVDESFCDTAPELSHMARTAEDGVIVIKSFGKFWGLAGLRLGFAIGRPDMLRPHHGASGVNADDLKAALGPWPVSGPALEIGARALEDMGWAEDTRSRLKEETDRLDRMLTETGARLVGGTSLFRTYEVTNAQSWQTRLAQHHIWTRIFPYNRTWLRLGLPHPDHWPRLEKAVAASAVMARPGGS
ncbi:pyridoxal phosphate-dependent class II aminotransferase [Rhodophyticola sp. CCM32]|uniref:threonine-phosphate decarboxylase n=1 Tax=Rhodophyticola sp. CCM32 TaxID=2916397 RepID=UPI00107F2336|nr:threonine-phosphate decarboxylase [Rhodophyticola sp. CCM32]QBY01773.1 pyridoxal phosphate-dependent class II aminotransferase [Rhodophyticola sp. CCM32]